MTREEGSIETIPRKAGAMTEGSGKLPRAENKDFAHSAPDTPLKKACLGIGRVPFYHFQPRMCWWPCETVPKTFDERPA